MGSSGANGKLFYSSYTVCMVPPTLGLQLCANIYDWTLVSALLTTVLVKIPVPFNEADGAF